MLATTACIDSEACHSSYYRLPLCRSKDLVPEEEVEQVEGYLCRGRPVKHSAALADSRAGRLSCHEKTSLL